MTKSKSKKGHNYANIFDRVMELSAVAYIVMRNKYGKLQVNMFDGIEVISIYKNFNQRRRRRWGECKSLLILKNSRLKMKSNQ